jgi:hypothetical protein
MRRALRDSLPAFSQHFGIHPWDVDRLTYGEIAVYLDALKRISERR